jgi:hypothetical protein
MNANNKEGSLSMAFSSSAMAKFIPYTLAKPRLPSLEDENLHGETSPGNSSGFFLIRMSTSIYCVMI